MIGEDRIFFFFSALAILASVVTSSLDFVFLQKASLRVDPLSVVGVVLIISGVVIRLQAIRTLGRYFSNTLRIVGDHKLVTEGIYKHLRHPAYTGIILSLLGVPLIFSSAYGFVVMLLVIPPLVYRIGVEEKMLIVKFGERYEEYSRHSKKLVPYVY
jgi:protein-S-isoprenylcysteine O-methyltransferase Ste14